MHAYHKETGRNPITAQMASESKLRTQKWLQHGCNGFDLEIPTSNPMAFWTEQDVLRYIVLRNIQIASVYGEVVPDYEAMDMIPGQYTLSDIYDDKTLTGFSEKKNIRQQEQREPDVCSADSEYILRKIQIGLKE